MADGTQKSMCQPIAFLASYSPALEKTPLPRDSWRAYRLPPSTRNALNESTEEYFFIAGRDVNVPEWYEVVSSGTENMINFSQLITMHLDNNRPCAVGFCRNGICVESRTQSVGRLWPLLLSSNAWSRSYPLQVFNKKYFKVC